MFERNMVVVEPCFEIMLCHANIGSCLTECGSDSGLVYDFVDNTRAVKKAKVFLCALGSGACIILPPGVLNCGS